MADDSDEEEAISVPRTEASFDGNPMELCNPWEMSALYEAVMTGDKENVSIFLLCDTDPNQLPGDAFVRIVETHDIGMLNMLIEGGMNPNLINDVVLCEILNICDIEMLMVLIEGGLQMEWIPDRLIPDLCVDSNKEILKVLIERGLELKRIPESAIHNLASDMGMLKVMLERGLDVDLIPHSVIHRLCNTRSDLEMLKVLVERGLNLYLIPDIAINELIHTRDFGLIKALIQRGLSLKRISIANIAILIDIVDDKTLQVLMQRGLKITQIPDSVVDRLIHEHTHDDKMLKDLMVTGLELKRIPDSVVDRLIHSHDTNVLEALIYRELELTRLPEGAIQGLLHKKGLRVKERFIEKAMDVKGLPHELTMHFLHQSEEYTIKALLRHGLNPNKLPNFVIWRFLQTGNNEMLRMLNKAGLDPTKETLNRLSDKTGSGMYSRGKEDSGIAVVKQLLPVVQENNMDAFMSIETSFTKAYPHQVFSRILIHIVAIHGTTQMVDCMNRWTRIDWDRPHVVHEDLCKEALESLTVRNVTALYLATCLNRKDIVKSLVKLAGEYNIWFCLKELEINSEMEQVFMMELTDRLRRKHAELKPTIVPGHQRDDKGTRSRVFIVYSVSVVQAEVYDYNGLGLVKLRNPFVIRRSNNFALVCEARLKNKDTEIISDEEVDVWNEDDAKRVTEAIQTHRNRLWKTHSNLNIITGRKAKTNINGSVIDEVCVVLYCSTKGVIPLGEEEFPRALSTPNDVQIKVVVSEGFFDFGVYRSVPSTWPHSTLKMGCEMGRLTPQFDASGNPVCNSSGTLGPFVRYNNNLGFLTCSHVLFDIPTPSHTIDYTAVDSSLIEVVQPSSDATPFVSRTPCGVVERALFDPTRPISIDAAIVKLTDKSRVPSAGQFSNERHSSYQNAGFHELPEYNNGSKLTSAQVNNLPSKPNVVKFGSRTDVTRGALSVVGADVRAFSTTLGLPNNASGVLMRNQYLVIGIHPSTDFFDGGDSGSGVFCQDSSNGQLQCVGMAIGHGVLANYPYKVGVVTPIDAILEALGPDISLATFP